MCTGQEKCQKMDYEFGLGDSRVAILNTLNTMGFLNKHAVLNFKSKHANTIKIVGPPKKEQQTGRVNERAASHLEQKMYL